jgi:hypothetical protein
MRDGCTKTHAAFHSVDEKRWACAAHAEPDMISRSTGRAKGDANTRGRKQCFSGGCMADAKCFTLDREIHACDMHAYGEMWRRAGRKIVRVGQVETKESKLERSRPSEECDMCGREPEVDSPRCASCSGTRVDDDLFLLRPDTGIMSTTGLVQVYHSIVGPHLGLSKGVVTSVPYPASAVLPVVAWCFKEDWLCLNDLSYERVIQTLNFARGYPLPKLHAVLRDRLVTEYKDLSHAKLLTACEDTVVQHFLCKQLAAVRLDLAGLKRCFNHDGPGLRLCCKCDAGRLSAGSTEDSMPRPCSYYSATATPMPQTGLLPITKNCCLHGQLPSPIATLIVEILKQLPDTLRDLVDTWMM